MMENYDKEFWENKKCPKYDCKKESCKCGLKKVYIPTALGDDSKDSPVAPKNGAYCNAVVVYEANDHVYIYSTEGIPTLINVEGDWEEAVKKVEDDLAQEILDRQDADNTLQNEIDAIKNSPDVVDIVPTYADLMDYDTSKLGDNDIVRVLQDEQHDGQSTYYRWDKQNSTWTYIGAVGDYYTKGQVDNLLGDKQNKLTTGANISITQVDDDLVISATDTTYSNFVGTDGNTGGTAGLVPAPATTDAGKFLKADGTWDTAGGGGGPTVVQTTGTSTIDVMSQNATTGMVYADPATKSQVQVGDSANGASTYAVAIGANSKASNRCVAIGGGSSLVIERTRATGDDCVALGAGAQADDSYSTAVGGGARAGGQYSLALGYGATSPATYSYAIALGAGARTAHTGEMNIGTGAGSGNGYNSSDYRLISGVYDGQNDHDAVTLSQLNGRVKQNAGAPTTATVGTVGQLLEDTTNGKLYQCTAASGGTYTWTEVGAGGGGVTPVQTTGTSTTDVMSQDATTKLIYPDIANRPHKIVIGEGTIDGTNKGLAINGVLNPGINGGSIAIGTPDGNNAQIGGNGRANQSIAIGNSASAGRGMQSIAIGTNAYTNSGQDNGDNTALGFSAYAGNSSATSTVALGAYAKTTRTGEVNIGTGGQNQGYNSTDYRVIGGVHDGQLANDAVTVGQVNSVIDAINTALSTNIPHIGA